MRGEHFDRRVYDRSRRIYSFDRDTYDRAAAKRHALGLGGCFGGPAHVASASAPINFASYFTTCLQSVQTDLGLTVGTSWVDQGPSAKNYTSTVWPTTGTGPNGFTTLIFNGTSQYVTSALNLVAPSAGITWIGIVFRQLSWTSGRYIVGDSAAQGHLVYQFGSTPSLVQYDGFSANSVATPAINTWECTDAYFTNSTSDYLQRNAAVTTTSTAGGAIASTGRAIGASAAPSLYSNIEVLHVIYATAPSLLQRSNWRAAVTAKYGI
jgi:hypothetical protein